MRPVHRRQLQLIDCFFFSEDSPQFGGKGKYRKTPIDTELYFSSENEMKKLYEPLFDIIELTTVDIAGKAGDHKAICAYLAKKYR